ncbi:4Fe-4S binding protein [Alkalinema pantanalense CENA528]|uniref:4Fe-4S binding protein n=1 Tax=Alkalinema pantanalense TaxID=1620705 RepID=UPI003D6F88AB
MIELVSHQRCISCNVCVQVCPTNVFDAVPDQPPVIARQADCQTCFMCEAYCPADALYVAPQSHTQVPVDEAALIDRDILGEYRRILGWGYGRKNNSDQDAAHKLRQLPRPYQSQA